jgi:hypothetical protein
VATPGSRRSAGQLPTLYATVTRHVDDCTILLPTITVCSTEHKVLRRTAPASRGEYGSPDTGLRRSPSPPSRRSSGPVGPGRTGSTFDRVGARHYRRGGATHGRRRT